MTDVIQSKNQLIQSNGKFKKSRGSVEPPLYEMDLKQARHSIFN